MRILYCNKYNFPFSGTEVYLFELMDMMRAHGHEVALFSMTDSRGEPTPFDSHFAPYIDFKAGSRGPLKKLRQAAHAIYSRDARTRLRRMIEEFCPDVAHVRNIYHHLSPSILWELKAQRVPVIYHLNDFKLLCPSYNLVAHGQACERCHGGKFRHVLTEGCYEGPRGASLVLAAEAYAHKWMGTFRRCVDRFLAPSCFVKDKFVEHGWPEERFEVLPHFQRLPVLPPAKAATGGPILYFGRLSPEKGVSDLVRAMSRLPQVQLMVAGDGLQRAELQRLGTELGLRNIEFTGNVKRQTLDSLIAASRFTVFPSRAYETLGKSILESYAWERPVVASDLGSRRELVQEGETGLLYPPGDVVQMAAAISSLTQRPEVAARMGIAGRELVRLRHSPDEHYRKMIELYEQSAHTPPMRIAFIGARGVVSKYSGIETYYEHVGGRLAKAGHDVTVYCRNYFTPNITEYQGMRVVRLPTVRSKHLETAVHTLLSTVHAMFGDCDIVHYHCLGPALFSFLPRLIGKKTVVTVQGLDWQRKKWGRVASAALRAGEWAAVQLPHATMVVSHTLRRHYFARHGAQTIYVPNGTSMRNRAGSQRLGSLGVTPGNYILFLGRFSPEKNCHLLIDAYVRINTSVKLVLAGGSSHSDTYANSLRCRESDRIRVLDWVSGDALEELLTNAALFVLPSDLEGLSLALLDAMGAGVCVLASDIPENCEAIESAGFTFQRGNVDDLERMLRRLIFDAELRECAAVKGRERARKHYLWDDVAKRVEAVYQQLLKSAARGTREQIVELGGGSDRAA